MSTVNSVEPIAVVKCKSCGVVGVHGVSSSVGSALAGLGYHVDLDLSGVLLGVSGCVAAEPGYENRKHTAGGCGCNVGVCGVQVSGRQQSASSTLSTTIKAQPIWQ